METDSCPEALRWRRCATALALACLVTACAAPPSQQPDPAASAEETLGIRVKALRLSAHNHILDLRYRVLDPQKAAPLLNSKNQVYLIDDAHQARLGVPQSPVIGAMRQTSRNRVIYTDRDYFILFENPGRAVRAGDKLQLAVDGKRVAELSVAGRGAQ